MKKFSLLLMAVVLLALVSCKKDNSSAQNNTQQALIVGKWSLQKQRVVLYVDGAMQSDSTFTTSNKIVSYVQFNKGGSFTAISLYNSNGIGSTDPSSQVAVDSLSGTYGFVGSIFSLSALSLGSLRVPTITGGIGGVISIPVIQLISQSAKISYLTPTSFTLHTEYTIEKTIDSDSKRYKTLEDSYYSKQQ